MRCDGVKAGLVIKSVLLPELSSSNHAGWHHNHNSINNPCAENWRKGSGTAHQDFARITITAQQASKDDASKDFFRYLFYDSWQRSLCTLMMMHICHRCSKHPFQDTRYHVGFMAQANDRESSQEHARPKIL